LEPIHAQKFEELSEPAQQVQVDELFTGGDIRFPTESLLSQIGAKIKKLVIYNEPRA
jgi:hypothetical protein